jgi:hypothetical protein
MTLAGYVLVDKRTGEIRGGLNSIACVYTEAGVKRLLEEFTRKENQERWEIKPAKLEVCDEEKH